MLKRRYSHAGKQSCWDSGKAGYPCQAAALCCQHPDCSPATRTLCAVSTHLLCTAHLTDAESVPVVLRLLFC